MKDHDTGVQVDGDRVLIGFGQRTISYPLQHLPQHLMDWFILGRKAGYDSLSRGEGPGPLFSRHLPVVATIGNEEPFFTRLAHKGVGFLPQPDRIDEHIARYEGLFNRTARLPPENSMVERLKHVSGTFAEAGTADPRLLGSLEIFAGQTFANLRSRPLASLLFTDPENGYTSFQLDCVVQTVEPPDPRFRFLFLARSLFERDPFHVTQPGVHCAYLFWIVGIHDKTPRPVKEGSVRHKL